MKVLHVISSGGMYGAESVILNISRILNEGSHRGILGVFLNSSSPNLQLHETATRDGIESHLIPCKSRVDWSAVKRIRELAAETGIDVVHAHGYKADLYVYLALQASKVALVSTCHTWYKLGEADYVYGLVDRLILRRYTRIVAVSEGVREYLLRAACGRAKLASFGMGSIFGLSTAPLRF